MSEVKKWIVVASVSIDDFRMAWVQEQEVARKIPVGMIFSDTPGIKEHNRAGYILWGRLHFMFIALNNLRKAVEADSPEYPESPEARKIVEVHRRDVKLLRDIYEHWEQKEIRSLKDFKKDYPDKNPHSMSLEPFVKFDIAGIDLDEFQRMINQLEVLYDL